MSILLKCLFLLSLLLISSPYTSKSRFANAQEDTGDPSVSEKFEMGLNIFHGSQESDAKPEDGGFNTWFQKPSFGVFGENDNEDIETNYLGSWKLDKKNAGVAAMQLQLMPNNKVIWFDTTALGPSALQMYQPPNCPKSLENETIEDCFSHAVEYDIETAKVRPLKLQSDPWCSSGVLAPNGDLVATGGYGKGIKAVRIISPTPNSKFKEVIDVLASNRWYPSNAVLEDGSYVVVGGRNSFDYEIVPPDTTQFQKQLLGFKFLVETTDKTPDGRPIENNLYPFLFLLPDGNTLIFANNRSIIFEPRTAKVIRELPVLPGGSRCYPSSGSAVILPLELGPDNSGNVDVTMLVCGGNSHDAFILVDGLKDPQRVFAPALQDCGRIVVTKEDAQWEIEQMPSPRLLGDMLVLPNGQVLIINGAKKGAAGWENGDDANLTPVLYNPKKPCGSRFKKLAPTTIPRMYHSCACVLPDANILLAGSNPHHSYTFNVKYNTELRVEKFDPPYLDPAQENLRPVILDEDSDKTMKYGQNYYLHIKLDVPVIDASVLKVTMYSPPFTTHAFSMNQRLIVLKIDEIANHLIKAVAPPSGKIAPPGYYLVFAVYRGLPSKGIWVQIGS